MGLTLFIVLGSFKPISILPNQNIIIINKLEIKILGSSSVNKFKCSNSFPYKDTIYLDSSTKNSLKSKISMNNFDCGHKIMNKDLKKTVKATEFPQSMVTITDIKPYGTDYKCNLIFQITNKTLSFKNLLLKNTEQTLDGTISLNFSDAGLRPPTKMGGLIKVKEKFTIQFYLYKS